MLASAIVFINTFGHNGYNETEIIFVSSLNNNFAFGGIAITGPVRDNN